MCVCVCMHVCVPPSFFTSLYLAFLLSSACSLSSHLSSPCPAKHTHTHTHNLSLSIYLSVYLSVYLSIIYIPALHPSIAFFHLYRFHFSSRAFHVPDFSRCPFLFLRLGAYCGHAAQRVDAWQPFGDRSAELCVCSCSRHSFLELFFFSLLTISFFSFILFYFIFSPILSSYH